jgi:hypothetical protein
MEGETYRVVLPKPRSACFAVIVRDGDIVDAAPIARWAIGKSLAFFSAWVKRKGGKIDRLSDLV